MSEDLWMPYSFKDTQAMFPEFVDHLGDRLSSQQRGIYEKILTCWSFQKISERLNRNCGVTVIHGDTHVRNYLYPRDPERDRVCLVDWQEWGIGLGPMDLADTMVLWWHAPFRAAMEAALLRRYHGQLLNHGVANYDWERCWDDYRLSIVRIMLYPIWMYKEERPRKFWWPILEKAFCAFQDLGCMDLINQERI
jgi:thiamine kinase-like enzyme